MQEGVLATTLATPDSNPTQRAAPPLYPPPTSTPSPPPALNSLLHPPHHQPSNYPPHHQSSTSSPLPSREADHFPCVPLF
ncbi:hypothetical protein Pmani_021262 [Petrolisthes manimaculis]|uniref:Uncharacterized protein n=1 Tax=Petrolisthes manimaculis TaxID=1843537 RepID=A0AAE1U2A9_9EUCA|nr:hypothetical protein Pmani_021262 [Petrolisthes manimaculis]